MRESFATYAARYWIDDLAIDAPTDSRVRARVYSALKRAGIPLAVPAVMHLTEVHDKEHRESKEQRERERYLEALEVVPLFDTFTPQELTQLADGLAPAIYVRGGSDMEDGGVAEGKRLGEIGAEHYHTVDDELDPSWSFAGTLQDVLTVASLVGRLADGETPPAWKPASEFADIERR